MRALPLITLLVLACGAEPEPLDGGSGGGSVGGGSAGGGAAGGSAGGTAGGAGGGSAGGAAGGTAGGSAGGTAGGSAGGSGGGTTFVKLDGGCYLIQPGFFQRDQFNEGIRASLNGPGFVNDVALRFSPVFRQNYRADAGPTGLDAGSYDVAQVNAASQRPFTLVATMNTGPLGGGLPASYLAIAGTVVLDQTTTPPSSEARGRFQGIALHEFSGAQVLLDGGRCAVLADATFDTLVPLGVPCSFATECGDTFTKSCQPSTHTCQLAGCNSSQVVVGNQICLAQSGGASALYDSCSLSGPSGCKSTETCLPYFDPAAGLAICQSFGTAAEDAACTGTDVNTGCASGLLCAFAAGTVSRVCVRPCDRRAAQPGCKTSQRCYISTCTAAGSGLVDSAAVGQACAASNIAKVCGDDGLAYRGNCVFELPDGGPGTPMPGTTVVRRCRTACRTQADCAGNQQCLDQACF